MIRSPQFNVLILINYTAFLLVCQSTDLVKWFNLLTNRVIDLQLFCLTIDLRNN